MGTNTGIGIGIGIPFKNNALGGDRPYLPPELKARLIGVWDNYGKKNTDADRNIIKNKIPNAGGDLEILNAAYKLNSGFGEYKEDFTSWRIYPNIEVTDNVITTNGNFNSTWFIYKHANENEINEMNIKVSGIPEGGIIRYFYIPDETATIPVSYNISKDGVYHLPKSKLSSNRISVGFTVSSSYDWNNIRIEQLSDFGGAFVTDGVNDMIISQKTLQEMGVTKDFTIVSMIHQISWRGSSSIPLTNYIRPTDNIYVRNQVADIGKTGIYGYVVYDIKNSTVGNSYIVNTILGDKNDYSIYTIGDLSQGKFSVQGYIDGNSNIRETSSVAHYWTFALLGKATEDDINLIIAYFNLDRTLKPDIRCNIERQGITNDNHADFNDKLVDYSGNGRDIQMYNLAWKGGSGIAAKPYETIKDYKQYEDNLYQEVIIHNEFSYTTKSKLADRYWAIQSNRKDNESLVVTIITDKDCEWICNSQLFNSEGVQEGNLKKKQNVFANTPTEVTIAGRGYFEIPEGYTTYSAASYINLPYSNGEVTVTFIPSCKGGILLDGINDFGKVIDMPIYKDYTFIIDRQIIFIGDTAGIVASKSEDSTDVNKQGAFLFEYLGAPNNISAWSFYKDNGKVANTDFTRGISYQSKYSYNGIELLAGTALDSDKLWLGILRDRDSRFANVAIYSLMSFPYTMSKFLIERQLKKHKLGTLYPDMVEFRPIVKSNNKWNTIEIWQGDKSLYRPTVNDDKTGIYLKKDSTIGIYVKPKDADEVTKIVVNGTEYTNLKINSNGFYYVTLPITKSPQKINITIDWYIRFEDIVQPYPSFVKLENLDRTHTYTWGDKLKVGDIIRYNSSKNLLEGAYTLRGQMECNGVYVFDNNQQIVVTKEMVFAWSHSPIWNIDDNEPKCILSPRLLRIPNSSYKILGYIPDISGHGNNGVIHNSAYAEGSGVNEDGSYQFDGVDDFITIPTTVGGKQVLMKVNWQSIAGTAILYDQRTNGSFAIFNRDFDTNENKVPAYRARNIGGSTYIDGILNEYIYASELKDITHNIVELCDPELNTGTLNPKIGSSFLNSNYTQMSLYDFMLFDEISTEAKIKELNTYIGITPKVTLPNYYWDNYGKKNTDANRGHVDEQVSLQKTGTSVNPLENFNISYEGMSGYNGYPVVFGASKTWESLSGVYGYTSNVTNTTIHVTHAEHAGNGLLFSYVKKDGALANIKEIPAFRVTVGGLEGNSKFGYRYLATEDATEETLVYLGNGTHELAKSFAPTEALLDLTRNVWVGIFITPMIEGEVVFDCDITIEVLPEYENGLAYDGISDFSQNTEIEVVEDFTFLVKGSLLKGLTGSGGCIARKGDKNHYDTGGYAFIYCFDSPIESYRNSYYSFGKSFVPSKEIVAPPLIGYMTKTNVNGETTTFGTNSDIKGIIFGNWSSGYMNMVIYKSIFYTKTISLLEINFLKNLMEKDEIIDINHPIFISNTEDESNTSQDT